MKQFYAGFRFGFGSRLRSWRLRDLAKKKARGAARNRPRRARPPRNRYALFTLSLPKVTSRVALRVSITSFASRTSAW